MTSRILIALLLTTVLLFHCKSRGQTNGKSGTVDTTFSVNTGITPLPGELLWKAKWTEGKKEYIFLLSHTLDYQDGNGYDALFARRFVMNGKAWTPEWAYRDTVFGYGCDLNVLWEREFSGVQDLNGDGKKEVFFTYLHGNRCDAGMVDTRLVVNQANRGGRVIGFSNTYLDPPQHVFNEFLRENGQDTVIYKQLEPDLVKMGSGISGAASDKWDELLKWQESHQDE